MFFLKQSFSNLSCLLQAQAARFRNTELEEVFLQKIPWYNKVCISLFLKKAECIFQILKSAAPLKNGLE